MTPSDIQSHVLQDGDVSVTVLSLGAATQDWQVPDRTGQRVPVILGHADLTDYLRHPGHFGTIEGRVANRIGGAAFTLNGVRHVLPPNEGPNVLHGGAQGWCWRNWTLSADGDRAVELRLRSEDGDQGMPGAVDVRLVISLDGHRVTYDIEATPDRETPINIANHNYYALQGGAEIWTQELQVAASAITETDAALIPTGRLLPVAGTRYDYRQMQAIDVVDPAREGLDTNFALDPERDGPALQLRAGNGMQMRLWTDQPGIQIYTGHRNAAVGSALPGQSHGPAMGMAIEAQGFPDAVNHPAFPSVIHSPDRPYRQTTTVEIKAV